MIIMNIPPPRYILEEALMEADKSAMRQKHGAVVVYKNQVIARGHNYSLPIQTCNKRSVHAEQDALKKAFKVINQPNLPIYLVVVRRHLKDKEEFRNSKPCQKCTEYINKCIHKGIIQMVYYSCDKENPCF